jgi:hypothetical protein
VAESNVALYFMFGFVIYFCFISIKFIIYLLSLEPPTPGPYEYEDDEPDGSNYVTLPNGDRRLD